MSDDLKETPDTGEKSGETPLQAPSPEPAKADKPEEKKKQPIKPVLSGKSKVFDNPETVIVLQPGQVYIVPLDDKGNEIVGHGFKTNMTAYNRHYSNPKNFVLKKKA